jgi:hypothetical protein
MASILIVVNGFDFDSIIMEVTVISRNNVINNTNTNKLIAIDGSAQYYDAGKRNAVEFY